MIGGEAMKKISQLIAKNRVLILIIAIILLIPSAIGYFNTKVNYDILSYLPNDLETNDNKWFAALKFYGNDPEHKFNMEMCQFLSALQNSRDSLEHYFTDKDNFDTWKSNYLERHKSALLTKKQYEQLTHTEMLKKRNELLMKEFNKSAE